MEAVEKDTKQWNNVINFENRRYPRFDIRLPIEYHRIKSSFTHTGNISESGLLVYFPEEMDVRQHLRLKLFFPIDSELNTIKVLAEAVWMDNHLSKDQEYYPYGVKFVDISPEDGTKLRNFLRSLSSPLDDMLCLFNTLKVKFWIRKFMNPPGGYIPGRQRWEILSLLTEFDGNRGTKNQPRHGTVNFEKRQYPRFSVDLPVEYYKLGSLIKHDGKAMNASQGGLLLYFSELLQIGQYLRLKLFLSSDSTLGAIETMTEVVWTDIYLDEGGDYRTGVRFVDTSPEDMSKLKNYLLSLSH